MSRRSLTSRRIMFLSSKDLKKSTRLPQNKFVKSVDTKQNADAPKINSLNPWTQNKHADAQ